MPFNYVTLLSLKVIYKRMDIGIDLENLRSISLGERTLQGDLGEHRRGIPNEPFNYLNTLRMKSEYGIGSRQ